MRYLNKYLFVLNVFQKLTKDKGVVYHPQVEEYKTCTFVTWSDWDLGVC